jgi:antitoxin (DNA-binding transcriptional repressor) of toxin-antitoxin stability system
MTPTATGCRVESYDGELRRWLGATDHYLGNPPPGALFAVVVRRMVPGLLGVDVPAGERVGVCVVGRPVARQLPQDGSVGEVVRMWLAPGLERGTASHVLRVAGEVAAARGMVALIAYHDRTRHSGCIYKKAGFRKDGATNPSGKGWASRARPMSGAYEATPKRRWRLDLTPTATGCRGVGFPPPPVQPWTRRRRSSS